MPHSHRRALTSTLPLATLWLASICAPAAAQCELGWINDFGGAQTYFGDPPIHHLPDRRSVIHSLVSFDSDGEGPLPPRLIAGGYFTHIGGVEIAGIAQWDGQAWSALGPGLSHWYDKSPAITDMVEYDDDGAGPLPPVLYVASLGATINSIIEPPIEGNVLKWNGSQWTALPYEDGPGKAVSLAFFDDGQGERLYATGERNLLSRFEGDHWRSIWFGNFRILVRKIIPTRIDDVPVVALLGGYSIVGEGDVRIGQGACAWIGPTIGRNLPGLQLMGFGVNETIYDAVNFDEDRDGPLPESLYVVGRFTRASNDPLGFTGESIPAHSIARWDGHQWHGVGPDPGRERFYRGITAITVFDDGSGPALYAGGYSWRPEPNLTLIEGIAKWTGSAWRQIGLSFGALDYRGGQHGTQFVESITQIRDFVIHPDAEGNSRFYAAGIFTYADGLPALHIARLGRPFARGDSDADGDVDFKDISSALDHWSAGYFAEHTGPGDPNADGFVSFADITFILQNFGNSCP